MLQMLEESNEYEQNSKERTKEQGETCRGNVVQLSALNTHSHGKVLQLNLAVH